MEKAKEKTVNFCFLHFYLCYFLVRKEIFRWHFDLLCFNCITIKFNETHNLNVPSKEKKTQYFFPIYLRNEKYRHFKLSTDHSVFSCDFLNVFKCLRFYFLFPCRDFFGRTCNVDTTNSKQQQNIIKWHLIRTDHWSFQPYIRSSKTEVIRIEICIPSQHCIWVIWLWLKVVLWCKSSSSSMPLWP